MKHITASVLCLSLIYVISARDSRANEQANEQTVIEPYPGSKIADTITPGHRDYALVTGVDPKATIEANLVTTKIAGELSTIVYDNPPDKSAREIAANYREALAKAGFTILFECSGKACGPSWASSRWGRITGMTVFSSEMEYLSASRMKDGQDWYVGLSITKSKQQHDILRAGKMETGLVTVTAAQLKSGLGEKGKAVLDGLYFDHDKATLKPESKPALEVIAGFLKSNPELKVYIVGHTDSVGSFDYNLKLSRDRGQSVVTALIERYGIDKERVSAHGIGPLSPSRSNKADSGRAENRRVEMVER